MRYLFEPLAFHHIILALFSSCCISASAASTAAEDIYCACILKHSSWFCISRGTTFLPFHSSGQRDGLISRFCNWWCFSNTCSIYYSITKLSIGPLSSSYKGDNRWKRHNTSLSWDKYPSFNCDETHFSIYFINSIGMTGILG